MVYLLCQTPLPVAPANMGFANETAHRPQLNLSNLDRRKPFSSSASMPSVCIAGPVCFGSAG